MRSSGQAEKLDVIKRSRKLFRDSQSAVDRLHPFPVVNQGSRLFQWCDQAIKAKYKFDQILIPVAGVSTVGIGVATP